MPERSSRQHLGWGVGLVVIGLAALVVAGQAMPRTTMRAAPQATVTVDLGSSGGARLDARLSSNLSTPGLLEQAVGAEARLIAWAPPLVRLHAGADTGEPPLLPAGIRRGDWNFAPLDAMAATVRAYGGEPLINVRYAPIWMWTCPAPFSGGPDGVGTLRDPTFEEFADYMARLVGWYNMGGFIDEQGQSHSSGHYGWVRVWEVWNEPDESGEAPCHPALGGAALTPVDYVALWNVVVPRMLAVDPTIRVVGPGTAQPLPEYVDALLDGTVYAPEAVSYHAYGGFDNQHYDRVLLEGLDQLVVSAEVARGLPRWVTEINVSSAQRDDPYGRPWGPFGVAWGASAFRRLALSGATLVHQFEFIASPQFGLVDEQAGTPRLPYWRDLLLSRAFPTGSTELSSTSSEPRIEVLAARRPDGGASILLINLQVASPTDRGGRGVPTTVTVRLSTPTLTPLLLSILDATTIPDREPPVQTIAPGSEVTLTLAGYGMALIGLPTL